MHREMHMQRRLKTDLTEIKKILFREKNGNSEIS